MKNGSKCERSFCFYNDTSENTEITKKNSYSDFSHLFEEKSNYSLFYSFNKSCDTIYTPIYPLSINGETYSFTYFHNYTENTTNEIEISSSLTFDFFSVYKISLLNKEDKEVLVNECSKENDKTCFKKLAEPSRIKLYLEISEDQEYKINYLGIIKNFSEERFYESNSPTFLKLSSTYKLKYDLGIIFNNKTPEQRTVARERLKLDRCTTVKTQLAWLAEIGFTSCRCIFAHLDFAVLAARKRS